ncbi:DUF2252 family protein [Methylobacterium pseudosasicola]|uniref:Uncharacterized conserved protein, DUF2252 family n=1 Tax=Methylobacterium pseudosasicola TaxID=582667 RepID=A0A1I4GE57_9HYPH|nr:DUF2252 family protein [Methylobacterium pseudosasicola]SFL27451.1 Uncharacterized conserved protein, DUF2252 family [Methylobacterium pseudosasicola]
MDMQMPARSGREASELEQRRLCKIASSPHAYVRGSTAQFYELIAAMPAGSLPEGPAVWICGDAHLGNLGAVAGPDGRIDIQIRDLDQTLVSNPAFDLVRLALSLVTAALNATLPGIVTARMMDAMAVGYADGILDPDHAEQDIAESEIVATTRRRALGRRWRHLSRERLKGKDARLPRGNRFFDLDPAEQAAFEALSRDPEVHRLVLALGGAEAGAEIRLLDAAYWIKGCSSLGRLRYAGLVEISGGARPHLALLDVKEAVPFLAPPAPGADMPADAAARVVAGARALSPNLGDRMVAANFQGTPVTVRELMPQDLKIDAEQFSRGEAVRVSGHLAAILGRAHGRQMSANARRSWSDTVRAPGQGADTPGWLWSAVTDLMGAHQRGYLEHCRRIAREDLAA